MAKASNGVPRETDSPPGEGDSFFAVDRRWRILYAHGIPLRVLGLTLDGVMGRDLWEVFPMYTGTPLEEMCRRVMEERRAERQEILGPLTGRRYETNIYPTDDGICLYGRDITARKLVEEEVRRSEERYRALAEAVSTAVWTWDPILQQGDFDGVQRWWRALTGQSQQEQASRDQLGWLEAVHPDDQEKVRAAWTGSMERGEPYQVQYRVITPDGGERTILGRSVAVHEADGTVREWVGMLSDITERTRVEEALREADRRKDEFLAMLAHELRNPLAPIRSSAEVLRLLRTDGDPRMDQAVRMIDRQAVHMTRLVDDLLDVSRISRGKILLRRERTDLVPLVRATAEDHRPQLESAGLALALELPDDPLWLTGDPTRLSQIVGNLVQNAGKFTNAGGRVTVRVSADTATDRVLLEVEDTGIGMDAEMMERLFEPFSQADRSLARSRGGLGLGLSLVKGLVELHGGTVEASSGGSGRGSRFVISLPWRSRELAPGTPLFSATTAGPSRRILVIEDHADAAESLRLLLEIGGHQVEVVATGEAGLNAARRFRPDLVLCDIGLPGMDGYAVARALRANGETDGICLVALSGYGRDEDRRRALEAGFDLHLTKPVDLATLSDLVQTLSGC